MFNIFEKHIAQSSLFLNVVWSVVAAFVLFDFVLGLKDVLFIFFCVLNLDFSNLNILYINTIIYLLNLRDWIVGGLGRIFGDLKGENKIE
jgi:hypothetical protein